MKAWAWSRSSQLEDSSSSQPRARAVKERRFSPYMFIWTFALLCVLAGGQALILGAYAKLPSFPPMFVAGMTGYWAIVAGTLSLITYLQIRKRLEPMRKFSEASRQVASGDFSVYLEPEHLPESTQWDANDEMFEDFNTMVHELGSIETMKNDFVANVSHEIKTPLAIIQSYVQLLGKSDLSDEQRSRYAATVTDASERLGQFVTNILKLSKLENQGISLQIENCDLPRQLSDAVLAYSDLFDAKNVTFDVDMEDRALVKADSGVLEVVWSNILGNALKFTERGGHVSLRQSSDNDIVSVEIRDNGCGMSKEELAHVFDKFYQGDTSHAARGNGLGMAMVRRAVELSGGTVTLSSVAGQGTEVLVRLPAAQ
ncbi:HAMP domain-containing sensor histidine kinase [Bifidobacterium sp.]|uniref:HAMP domain-containing sensor histidine kinase n=1 Tax=Bifidobacterium sp. TaxID=41200 RepID=UPI0025B8AB65|nr:HAMP domain-containing sensor histidine kinase [Bifidobacterium sp.]MCI1634965.1 HAMP domain-containing histidine kinase [Bifidobacterium sp.]